MKNKKKDNKKRTDDATPATESKEETKPEKKPQHKTPYHKIQQRRAFRSGDENRHRFGFWPSKGATSSEHKSSSEEENSSDEKGVGGSSFEKTTSDAASQKRAEDEVDPTFSKRKLASNWDRYEAPLVSDEELDPTEYNYVLSLSTGTKFQFVEEKSWNEDEGAEMGALQLDFGELSAALECIPLPVRLRIPTDVFKDDQLKKFDSVAKEKAHNYAPSGNIFLSASEKEETKRIIETVLKPSIQMSGGEIPKETPISEKENLSCKNDSRKPDLIESGLAAKTSDRIKEIDKKISGEVELADLLSMPAEAERSNLHAIRPGELEAAVGGKEEEEHKDTLQWLKVPEPENTESLEDWLDTVLED